MSLFWWAESRNHVCRPDKMWLVPLLGCIELFFWHFDKDTVSELLSIRRSRKSLHLITTTPGDILLYEWDIRLLHHLNCVPNWIPTLNPCVFSLTAKFAFPLLWQHIHYELSFINSLMYSLDRPSRLPLAPRTIMKKLIYLPPFSPE